MEYKPLSKYNTNRTRYFIPATKRYPLVQKKTGPNEPVLRKVVLTSFWCRRLSWRRPSWWRRT